MILPPLNILFEDNHCLAINKPAGFLTTGFTGGEQTLDRQVKVYIKEKYDKRGNVFLGIVHRLDRPVSGVLMYARNSKAAGRLAAQFRDWTTKKVYRAVVEGRWPEDRGDLLDYLKKDHRVGIVERVEPETSGAKEARLSFEVISRDPGYTHMQVRPHTGRTHQIRVQLASRGFPILGDRKYGSARPFANGIALHAAELTILHPIRFEPITLTAELPPSWAAVIQ